MHDPDLLRRRLMLASTAGAVAQVDAFEHATLHGVRWPTFVGKALAGAAPMP